MLGLLKNDIDRCVPDPCDVRFCSVLLIASSMNNSKWVLHVFVFIGNFFYLAYEGSF